MSKVHRTSQLHKLQCELHNMLQLLAKSEKTPILEKAFKAKISSYESDQQLMDKIDVADREMREAIQAQRSYEISESFSQQRVNAAITLQRKAHARRVLLAQKLSTQREQTAELQVSVEWLESALQLFAEHFPEVAKTAKAFTMLALAAKHLDDVATRNRIDQVRTDLKERVIVRNPTKMQKAAAIAGSAANRLKHKKATNHATNTTTNATNNYATSSSSATSEA